MTNQQSFSRRKFVRNAGLLSGVGAIGSQIPTVEASNCALDEYPKNNPGDFNLEFQSTTSETEERNFQGEYYSNHLRYNFAHIDSLYSSENDYYAHYFGIFTHGSAFIKDWEGADWEFLTDIEKLSIEINNNDLSLGSLAVDVDQLVGGLPQTGDPPSTELLKHGFTLGNAALSLKHPYVALATTIGSIGAQMLFGSSSSNGSNPTYTIDWDYVLVCECYGYQYFYITGFQGENSCKVGVKTSIDAHWGNDNEIERNFTIIADSGGGGGCHNVCPTSDYTTSENPNPGTDEYRKYVETSDRFNKVTQNELNHLVLPEDFEGSYYRPVYTRVIEEQ